MTEYGQAKETSRRAVLGGAAVVGAGAVLAACGGNDSSAGSGPTGPASTAAPGTATGGSTAIAKAADVPVGSGLIVASAKTVVTQPKTGEFKAFSAICTHMGCTVSKISGDTITCPCHGSQYSTLDGSVKKGPAPKPLPPVDVTEKSGEIFLA